MPVSIEARKLLFDCLDLLKLSVPAALQLVGYETIPRIDRVVLLKRLSRLIRQLFEFAGQCDSLRNISGTEFLNAFRLASTPRCEMTFSSSWPSRRSTEAPPK